MKIKLRIRYWNGKSMFNGIGSSITNQSGFGCQFNQRKLSFQLFSFSKLEDRVQLMKANQVRHPISSSIHLKMHF